MRKSLMLTLLLISYNTIIFGQPIVFDWANPAGGKSSYEGFMGMAKDAAGNIYISSEFSGTKDFGCAILVAQGFSDVFVAKYSPSGNCLWAVRGGASFASAYAGKIAVDANYVFVTGKFSNIITFGSVSASSSGGNDIFIASLNINDGSCNWISKAGGAFADAGVGISTCTGGGIYVCGNFTSTATFDAFSVSSSSPVDDDIFYARYGNSGSCLWVKRVGSTGNDYANTVKEIAGGNIILTGGYEGTVQFGTGPTFTSAGGSDIYLLSANSSGDVIGARSGGGVNTDVGYELDVDPGGNIYMAGVIYSAATFGSVVINTNQNLNIVVVKYNNLGVCLWANTAGNTNDDAAFGISTDAFGSSYVTGYINGNAIFGTTSVTGVQTNDVFVAKYTTTGSLVWVTKAGGPFFDRGKAVVKDVAGYCYVSGDFTENATFGTINLVTDPGTSAAFVTKIGGGTIGVDELKDAPFTIFPNPSPDKVTISFNNIQDAIFTIDLLGVDGRLLNTFTLNHKEAQVGYDIDLKEYSSGSYLLRVNTSEGDFTRKLLIRD